MHALIIEDEPLIAVLLEDLLRAYGCTSIAFAATQAEAIAAARARCPDLITSDVRLAEGCGVAAVEAICSEQRAIVVFITATPWAVRERMRDAVVVEKPFTSPELSRALALAHLNTQ